MAYNRGEAGEIRRRFVVNVLSTGKTQEEAAQLAELSQSGVSRILKRFAEKGEAGLTAQKSPGAPAKLTREQKAGIPEILVVGPQAFGFEGSLWTRKRVQAVIAEKFGVLYSETHVGALLKEAGFSLQKPRHRD
jgi:transposase